MKAFVVALLGVATAIILLSTQLLTNRVSSRNVLLHSIASEKTTLAPLHILETRKHQKPLIIPKDIAPVFHAATKDRHIRKILKARLTMLCDEGRSHPQYWALKTELDRLDGGEDDSDVVDTWASQQMSDVDSDWKVDGTSFDSDLSDLDSDLSTSDLDNTMSS